MEKWKPIEGYEGVYEISSYGRVKSLSRRNSRKERILKQYIMKSGYHSVNLHLNARQKSFYVHRLVLSAFIENKEKKKTVNHKDGNKSNNRIENLEWSTPCENNAHARKNGLIDRKGEKCNFSKLTEKDVIKIRLLAKEGEKQYKIAEKFNVSRASISLIVNRKNWKHI